MQIRNILRVVGKIPRCGHVARRPRHAVHNELCRDGIVVSFVAGRKSKSDGKNR
jgi:hypothetical protein